MDEIIACICEGEAERAIISILMESNLIIFESNELLGREIITTRSAKDFQTRYLQIDYQGKLIKVIRILDKSEGFTIKPPYLKKISEIRDYITRPEIEMLVIIAKGKYDEYTRSYIREMKPSTFCKSILKIKEVKTYDYIYSLFSDTSLLLSAIKVYHRCKGNNGLESIFHLLQDKYK